MRPRNSLPNNFSIWQAFFCCLILFIVFFALNKSFISAYEDLHIEYLLSGGYGQTPDTRLHYLYGWHPFVFSPVYLLYNWMPETNWYGIFLIAIQFLAHFMLIHQMIGRVGFKTAYPVYIVFFFLFGFPFLQKLEISTTSSLLALAACSRLLFNYSKQKEQEPRISRKQEILLILCLVFASLLRFHTTFLVLALFALASTVLLHFKGLKALFITGIISIIISLALFHIQKLIYEHDPAYTTWKTKSDLYFSMTNRPNTAFVPADSIQKMEASFILNHYWIDSSIINPQKIDPLIRSASFSAYPSPGKHKEAFFWAFQNNRLSLLLIAVLLVASFLIGGRSAFSKSLFYSLIGLSTFLGLLILFKIRDHIILTISAFIFLSVTQTLLADLNKKGSVFSYLLFLVLIILGCWRVVQQTKSKTNLESQVVSTKAFLKSCADSPENLYINPSNEGWMALGAFDSPRRFPMENVLTRELLMTGKFIPLFKRFHVSNLANQLPDNPRIVLLGASQPDWIHYYLWRKGKSIVIHSSPPLQQIPAFELKTQ